MGNNVNFPYRSSGTQTSPMSPEEAQPVQPQGAAHAGQLPPQKEGASRKRPHAAEPTQDEPHSPATKRVCSAPQESPDGPFGVLASCPEWKAHEAQQRRHFQDLLGVQARKWEASRKLAHLTPVLARYTNMTKPELEALEPEAVGQVKGYQAASFSLRKQLRELEALEHNSARALVTKHWADWTTSDFNPLCLDAQEL